LISLLRKHGEKNSKPNYSVKSDRAIEHDAYSVALMERLVGSSSSIVDSPAWFLTTDGSLVRFTQELARATGVLLPFLMPSQLLQVLRFAVPTNADYVKTFVEVFSPAYVGAHGPVPNETIHEILGRLARYEGMTAVLAESVLSDSLFIRRYASGSGDDAQEAVVRDALVARIEDLNKELEQKEMRLRATQAEANAARTEVASAKQTTAMSELQYGLDRAQLEALAKQLELTKTDLTKRNRLMSSALWLLISIGLAAIVWFLPSIPPRWKPLSLVALVAPVPMWLPPIIGKRLSTRVLRWVAWGMSTAAAIYTLFCPQGHQ
jgi:hypothetical protein